MGGCYGWLLWVVAMGGCYGWMLTGARSTSRTRYWEQHGKEIVIASSDPAHSCVELHTGWADKDSGTFDMCRFSESPCKFSVLVGGNYHPSPATHALAIPLDMSTFEVRRCAMRFALQLQPQLVEQADERLALARSGRAPSAGCCTFDPECGACPEKADWCGQSRENCLVCVKSARKQNASLYHNKRWCRLGAINPSSSHRRGGRPISGAVDLSDGAAATPSTKVELNRLKRARREAELNEDGDEIERLNKSINALNVPKGGTWAELPPVVKLRRLEAKRRKAELDEDGAEVERFTELIRAVWAELSPQTKLKWLKAKRRDAELDEDGAEVERFTELIEAIEAAKAPEPLRDDVSAVLIGIHIRAGRFYKGLHPDYTCKDDDVFADGESSNSTCYMEPEEFDPYADAARDLEQQYSDKYGADHTFLWIVFTDSNALLPSLLKRWDRAVPLKMGESSHSGCDAEGTSRVEWLMLSKCDMLVVSKSGFSMTAASYAEPMVPTLIVQSADNASSLTYMDEGNWNSWLGTAVGT